MRNVLKPYRLIANITRCIFWLGKRFEFALLLQSIFMIIAQVNSCLIASGSSITLTPHQLALLYICIHYRPTVLESVMSSPRPFKFWQWNSYTQYIEFLAGYMYAMNSTSMTLASLTSCAQNMLSDSLPNLWTLVHFCEHTGLRCLRSWEHVAHTTTHQVCLNLLSSATSISHFASNYKQKSLYGFRASTLIGWVGGDAFKFVLQPLRLMIT